MQEWDNSVMDVEGEGSKSDYEIVENYQNVWFHIANINQASSQA